MWYSKSEPEPDWAEKLVLPLRFSATTNKAIEAGVLTKKARAEIVTCLSKLMLVYTSRPSFSDLTTVSRRLVEMHQNLKDKL